MQRYLSWFGVEKEDVAKLKDGILISSVKLDGDQPPVDVLYVKYEKVKPFFVAQAWSSIEKHSMFYNLSVHLVLFAASLRDWVVEERRSPAV